MITNPFQQKALDNYTPYVVRPIPVTEDRVPAEDEVTGLDNIIQTAIMRMIVEPDANVDVEFEAMVKEWLSKGGQKITDQKNEAYVQSR